jgi:hypothetical protein
MMGGLPASKIYPPVATRLTNSNEELANSIDTAKLIPRASRQTLIVDNLTNQD